MLTGLGYPCRKLAFIDNTLCAVGAYHPSATLGAQQGVWVLGGGLLLDVSLCFISLYVTQKAMASEWVFPFRTITLLFPSIYLSYTSCTVTPILEDGGFHSAAAGLHTPRQ